MQGHSVMYLSWRLMLTEFNYSNVQRDKWIRVKTE